MSELWTIVQAHLDKYQVREAALARRMGVPAQTLNSWKMRGIRHMPTPRLLSALAREAEVPYHTVIFAALIDAGYVPDPAQADDRQEGDGDAKHAASMKTAEGFALKLLSRLDMSAKQETADPPP